MSPVWREICRKTDELTSAVDRLETVRPAGRHSGVKGGLTYGNTDDFGYKSIDKPVTVADFHATILHLLGLDYTKLSFHHDTRDERLTDVHQPNVIREILA